MRLFFLCAALAFAGILAAAAAEAPAKSDAFEACAAQAHGTTYPMLHCYSLEMQAADDAMTASYQSALAAKSDPKTKDYLTRSQAAWSDYRDAWCEATVSRSGTMARFKLFECRLTETARRAEELRDLAR